MGSTRTAVIPIPMIRIFVFKVGLAYRVLQGYTTYRTNKQGAFAERHGNSAEYIYIETSVVHRTEDLKV